MQRPRGECAQRVAERRPERQEHREQPGKDARRGWREKRTVPGRASNAGWMHQGQRAAPARSGKRQGTSVPQAHPFHYWAVLIAKVIHSGVKQPAVSSPCPQAPVLLRTCTGGVASLPPGQPLTPSQPHWLFPDRGSLTGQVGKSSGTRLQVQIPAHPLNGCVTLGLLPNLSEPRFSPL